MKSALRRVSKPFRASAGIIAIALLLPLGYLSCPPNVTGGIRVFLEPEGARQAGAHWRVDSGAWMLSGETVLKLSVGSHTVEYQSAAGWVTPTPETVAVEGNDTVDLYRVYTMTVPRAVDAFVDESVPVEQAADDLFAAFNRQLADEGLDAARNSLHGAVEQYLRSGGTYRELAERSAALPPGLYDEARVAKRRAVRAYAQAKKLNDLEEAAARMEAAGLLEKAEASADEGAGVNYVLFVNGINTNFTEFTEGRGALQDKLAGFAPGYDIYCTGFYNPDGIFELTECTEQKILEFVQQFADVAADSPTTAALRGVVEDRLDAGKNVIIVPHSQGNFHTREALNGLAAWQRASVSVLETGSPATFMPDGLRFHSRVDVQDDLVAGLSLANVAPFPYEGTLSWGDRLDALGVFDLLPGGDKIRLVALLNHHSWTDAYLVGEAGAAIETRIKDYCVPRVASFSVANGAASTPSRTVTLACSTLANPTQYQASESPTFAGAAWKAFTASPSFELSRGNGAKTVYFKVRNTAGESNTVSDTIQLNEAAKITVTAPATGTQWQAGTTQTIRWTYSGEAGSTVVIDLFKGGQYNATLAQSGTLIGSDGSGSFDWAIPANKPAGADYRIRVKSQQAPEANGESAPFSVTAATLPAVTAFSINNGAATTDNLVVTLNNTCTGGPTHYMASESSSFAGAEWLAYSAAPSFTLSNGNGEKTVHFKVKNGFGPSAPASDGVMYEATSLRVLEPNGGETWETGTNASLRWRSEGNTGNFVSLALFAQNGGSPFLARTIRASQSNQAGDNEIQWTVPTGLGERDDYYVEVVSASNGAVFDRSDGVFAIHAPLPDLVAGAVALEPGEPTDAQPVTARFSIANAGPGNASTFGWELLVDGNVAGSGSPASLAGGTSLSNLEVRFGPLPQGAHRVDLVVDRLAAVRETNETNNAWGPGNFTVVPAPMPDLVAGSVSIDPPEPANGQAITARASITNAGNADAGAFSWEIVVDGNVAGSGRPAYLAAGGTLQNVAATFGPLPAGQHRVDFVVDRDNAIAESNEGNNTQGPLTFSVPEALPDLVAGPLNVSPLGSRVLSSLAAINAIYDVYDQLSAACAVYNQGNGPAGSFDWELTVDGNVIAGGHPAFLEAGGMLENLRGTSGILSPGVHRVDFAVDRANAVAEADETNNTQGPVYFEVAEPLPDLVAGPLQISSLKGGLLDPLGAISAIYGTYRIYASCAVYNAGSGAAGPFGWEFRIDGALATGGRLDSLEAGGVRTGFQVTSYPLGSGSHRVEFVVDRLNEVAETNESNNTRSALHWVGGSPVAEVKTRLVEGAALVERAETVVLPGDVPLEMVWIPAGSFVMGRSPEERNAPDSEAPEHRVTLRKGFWLSRYEITQRQWQAVMGTTPWAGRPSVSSDPDSPAVWVSWNDAQAFAAALNELLDARFRLPSEAEWEYACRGGTTTRFYWGDDPASTSAGHCAWYAGNHSKALHARAVGGKLPNARGLYDMSGNVSEWCQDRWHPNYVGAPTNGRAWEASAGSARVLRGGSWNDGSLECRSSGRGSGSGANGSIGFRLAR